ncbi:MAG: hypothetical protein K8963_06970 [Proteobacteria bacterium]|nr:hypothetical protein [Pseudomonadota bacterium]
MPDEFDDYDDFTSADDIYVTRMARKTVKGERRGTKKKAQAPKKTVDDYDDFDEYDAYDEYEDSYQTKWTRSSHDDWN